MSDLMAILGGLSLGLFAGLLAGGSLAKRVGFGVLLAGGVLLLIASMTEGTS